jgi:ligand-binding sensor domain-containing protein
MLAPPLGDDAPGAPRLYVGAQGGGLTWLTDEGLAASEALDDDSRYVRQEATLYALCLHGAAPQRLYAGTERGLYASDDAGETWQRMGSALEGQRVLSLYTPPTASDTLLAGLAGSGVWFSQDDGLTWEPLGRGLGRVSVYALTLDELAVPPVLYAATSAGLWRLVLDV